MSAGGKTERHVILHRGYIIQYAINMIGREFGVKDAGQRNPRDARGRIPPVIEPFDNSIVRVTSTSILLFRKLQSMEYRYVKLKVLYLHS
jgi:hypothetical protein